MPFGEYKDFADCVRKVSSRKNTPSDPEAYCAWLKRKIEGYKKKKGQESNLKIMDKKEVLKILAEYEIEKFKKCLPN